ncbi:MAG: hypothetical protein Q8P61_04525 [Candidatus Nanopelagicales bacterium]|nr:hypothetical protein [Candidatus Nanopelagicales bacterium]
METEAKTSDPSYPARTPGGVIAFAALGALALIVLGFGALGQAQLVARGAQLVANSTEHPLLGLRGPLADRREGRRGDQGPLGPRDGRLPRDRGLLRRDRSPMGVPGVNGLPVPGDPMHGEMVMNDPPGAGVFTVRFARGEVTAVSGTSITIRCSDGYDGTFAIAAETKVFLKGDKNAITEVTAGSTVLAIGRVAGESTTATLVTDDEPGKNRRPARP